MSEDRRDEMVDAVESPDGFVRLRDLVKGLLDAGLSEEALLEDLSQIRALVPEEAEDRVLDVMDLLVGWCAPEFKLGRTEKGT